MDRALAVANRIAVVFTLTLKEAVRRRLIAVLVVCCAIFMLTGGGCTKACQSLTQNSEKQWEAQAREHLDRGDLSAEEKAELEARIERGRALAGEREKAGRKQLKSFLLGVSYSMIAFWLFLIAVVATPFLALNDFQNRTHVMLLSRPLQRWEYLVGKYLAILGMLLLNLVVLLGSYHLSMYISLGEAGLELYRGLVIFLQGIVVLAVLLMLTGLTAGRIPSIFIVVVVAGLSALPGLFMTSGLDREFEPSWQALNTALAYGLPQFGVNFFYGLGEAVDLPGLEEQNFFKKAGNTSGLYSLLINTGWFVLFWAALLWFFRRKELDT